MPHTVVAAPVTKSAYGATPAPSLARANDATSVTVPSAVTANSLLGDAATTSTRGVAELTSRCAANTGVPSNAASAAVRYAATATTLQNLLPVLASGSRSIAGDAVPTKCTSVTSSMNAITRDCGIASGCVVKVHTCVRAAVVVLTVTSARAAVTPNSCWLHPNCRAATVGTHDT